MRQRTSGGATRTRAPLQRDFLWRSREGRVSRAEEAGTGAVTPVDGSPIGPDSGGHSASARDAVVAGGPSGAKTARTTSLPSRLSGTDHAVHLLWYRFVQYVCAIVALVLMRWCANGRHHIPAAGGVLLVCNHVSFLDVFLWDFRYEGR